MLCPFPSSPLSRRVGADISWLLWQDASTQPPPVPGFSSGRASAGRRAIMTHLPLFS